MEKKRPESLFVKTAKKLGYFKKGSAFKPLPKKGTLEYKKIIKSQNATGLT